MIAHRTTPEDSSDPIGAFRGLLIPVLLALGILMFSCGRVGAQGLRVHVDGPDASVTDSHDT
jgi:hypothetical protein